ncbi:MAG: hypothetical protein V3T33_05565 [Myxococcota bacterium]
MALRHSGIVRSGLAGGLAWVGLAVLPGCVPTQRVPLAVEPRTATLYVDGQALETLPEQLVLRRDRAHKLYFKDEGYRPELVVLSVREDGAGSRLDPAQVRVRLEPLTLRGRDVEIREDTIWP